MLRRTIGTRRTYARIRHPEKHGGLGSAALVAVRRFRLTREAEEAFFSALVGAAMCPAF